MSREPARIADLEEDLYYTLFNELDLTEPYYEDLMNEIVDGITPIYDSDIFDIVAGINSKIDWKEALAMSQNDDNIIPALQAGIYSYLQQRAYEFVEGLKEFREEEEYLKERIEYQEEQITDLEEESDSVEKNERLSELKEALQDLENELESLIDDFKREWGLTKLVGE